MTMTTGIPSLCGVVGSVNRPPVTSGHGSPVLPRSAFAGFQGARRQKPPIGPPICAHNVVVEHPLLAAAPRRDPRIGAELLS